MTTNPFQKPGLLIGASILSADFGHLDSEIDQVLSAGADYLHLDVMDGHFVPNISFGPPVIASIRPHTSAYFDAHLMISEPLKYAPALVKAGANNLTFHVEITTDPAQTAKDLKSLGCNVGITLNPATPPESLYSALEFVDLVLVMSVVPGFSGQKFIVDVLPKISEIKKRLGTGQRLEVDGGVNPSTIRAAKSAGVDWFVVASALFGESDRNRAISDLRLAAESRP